jgi:hypothetical protein
MNKVFFLLTILLPMSTSAQHVNLKVPELNIPSTLEQWQIQRNKIRQTLVQPL